MIWATASSRSCYCWLYSFSKFGCKKYEWMSESHSFMSNSLQPVDYTVHVFLQVRILEWVLLHWILPTQGLNPGLQHCMQIVYQLCHQGSKEYNQSDFSTDHLMMSMCRIVSCVVGTECLLWPVCSCGKILLSFVLLNFVLQGQTWLLFQVSLDFLLHSRPQWWKGYLFLVLVLEKPIGLHWSFQPQLLQH